MDHWKNLSNEPIAHYSIYRVSSDDNGMDALRDFFPNGKADYLNFVLFSTSGVHGWYCTIEEVERGMEENDPDVSTGVTFLIVQPRLVALRYGNCYPQTDADFEFLKTLRQSSMDAIAKIGYPT